MPSGAVFLLSKSLLSSASLSGNGGFSLLKDIIILLEDDIILPEDILILKEDITILLVCHMFR